MNKKYALMCNQRGVYYGGDFNIEDTEHFNSLNDIKEMLLNYHHDIEKKDFNKIKKMTAIEIAEMFDWSIEEVKQQEVV